MNTDIFTNLAKRYNITSGENQLLDRVMLSIRANRPQIKECLPFTVFNKGQMLILWIQTPACRFSVIGKCTICDYWDGQKLLSAVDAVCDYIENNARRFEALLLNTCGSVLDEHELSHDDLMRILQAVANTSIKKVILETHLTFCDLPRIKELKEVLGDRQLVIEFGQESTNPNVLRYCLNKPSMLKRYSVLPDLQEHGVKVLANVVLGTPFLDVKSRINDVVLSIRDLISEGVDGVVLFPVNIKEYTLVWFLYEKGLYKRVEAREIFKVLRNLEAHELERVELAWWESREQNNISYESDIIGPLYCNDCGASLISSLQQYSTEPSGKKRKEILDEIMSCECDCEGLLVRNLLDIEGIYKLLNEYFPLSSCEQ